jgi:hypothetical protein
MNERIFVDALQQKVTTKEIPKRELRNVAKGTGSGEISYL